MRVCAALAPLMLSAVVRRRSRSTALGREPGDRCENVEWARGLLRVFDMSRSGMRTMILFGWLVACSTNEPAGGRPTTVTRVELPAACALGVSGTLATVSDTADGVALTLLTTPDKVDELRERARHAAEIHGPGAKRGVGHDGAHGQGRHHGLEAYQLPPFNAVETDVEAGARITLVPASGTDLAELSSRATEAVRRMNASSCR
jgi:hypothetical protein